MKKQGKGLLVFKWLCFAAYIISAGVLIFESCMDGPSSGEQSNAVGGQIMNIFNDLNGDASKIIEPTSLTINNKISEAYVGDTHQLTTTTLPEDTKFLATSFSSSDSSIASITPEGLISFKKQGEVTINAVNDAYPDIKDSFTISVKNIELISIKSSIDGVNPDSNNIYQLHVGNSYSITTIFTPENATNKKLTYSADKTTYLTVSNGIIRPTRLSQGEITKVTVTSGSLTQEFNIETIMDNYVELQGLSITPTSIQVGQTKSLPVSISPSNATYGNYTLSSSNTSIVRISGKSIVGVKEGTATITATSTDYPSIKASVEITVSPRPQATSLSASLYGTIVEGGRKKISVSVSPSNALTTGITYTSSDTSIAKVDSSGYVTGVKEGTTTITVKLNSLTKTVTVTVVKPAEPITVTDYNLNKTSLGTLKCNQSYNLSSLITVSSWVPGKPTNTSLSYSLEDTSVGTITGSTLVLTKPAKDIIIYVDYQGILKEVTIDLCYLPINISKDGSSVSNINTLPYDEFDISINETIGQDYIFEVSENAPLAINSKSNNEYHIYIEDECNSYIKVTPVFEGIEITEGAKTLNIKASHIKVNMIKVDLMKAESDEVLVEDITEEYKFYMNEKLYLKTTINENATISKLIYIVENEDVLKIDNKGNIYPISAGVTKVTVKDEFSSFSKEFTLHTYNVIKLDEANSYTISGHNIGLLGTQKDSFKIVNGYSYQATFNFTSDSTYRLVTYTVEDENVLTVSDSGTITPLKVGKTTVHVSINDCVLEPIEVDITIKVEGKPIIEDVAEFMRIVRKAIGHFGAFLVFGIFSILTYILFTPKKVFWTISIPLCIGQGFGLASLTEYIQTFVPGRYGVFADVLLDFYGFLISVILISLGFIITSVIQFIINKKRS